MTKVPIQLRSSSANVIRLSLTRNNRAIASNAHNGTKHSEKIVGESQEEEFSSIRQKLQQLAEDARPIPDDQKAGYIEDALPYNRIDLHNKIDKIVSNNFEHQYQKEIGISKIPSYAGKQTREIASAEAWKGKESIYDASLRMLNDKYKPLRKSSSMGNSKPLITPKLSLKQRLNNARENALDYSISKFEDKKKVKNSFEDEDDFGERYRERLLGPALFLNDSFAAVDNSISSLADQKIREAQNRGDFRNIPKHKPLPSDFTSTNAYIDRTEYHLNNVLKKQDAIPPWIEKQSSVDILTRRFRENLDREWRLRAVNLISELHPNSTIDEKITLMKEYIVAEETGKGKLLRSSKWEKQQQSYLETKIRSLNDTIRGYNLQSPLPSQKLYLLPDKERSKSYKRVAPTLLEALRKHLLKPDASQSTASKNSGNPVKFGDLYQRSPESIYQIPTESLGSMLVGLFKKKK